MNLFDRPFGVRRGDDWMAHNNARAVRPLRPHRLDAAETTRGVMEDQVVANHDAGVGGEGGEEWHQEHVA